MESGRDHRYHRYAEVGLKPNTFYRRVKEMGL